MSAASKRTGRATECRHPQPVKDGLPTTLTNSREPAPSSLPRMLSHNRQRHEQMVRSLDAPWFGEAILLGMQVWTEEELALHAKVSVEQVRMWIRAGMPSLPTIDGSVRISEAAFDEWAKDYARQRIDVFSQESRRSVVVAGPKAIPTLTDAPARLPSSTPDIPVKPHLISCTARVSRRFVS